MPTAASPLLRRGLLAAFVVGLGTSITLAQTALALLVLRWLWRMRDPVSRREAESPLWVPVLAFSGATVLSALASADPALSLWQSKDLFLVLAFYVMVDSLRRTGEAERLVHALALVGGLVAVLGVLQVELCPTPEPPQGSPGWLLIRCARARALFSTTMTLAGVLNVLLLATLPGLLSGGWRRGWLPVAWLAMLLGLSATYVRGAWLGFAAGVLAMLPTIPRLARALLLLGLVTLVGGTLIAADTPIGRRVRSIGHPQETASFMERTYMWRSGIAMWREHPWLGVGPGRIKLLYGNFALPEASKKRTGHLHNSPMQILVERGLLGLAAWLSIWAVFYRRAGEVLSGLAPGQTVERALVAGSLAAVTGFLVHGLSEYNFGDSETVMVAWAIMALPFVAVRPAGANEGDPPGGRERGGA
jgi:putative inorganic carbon (HCO3(-)) transporter